MTERGPLIRELNLNPAFADLCADIKTHVKPVKWKKGCSEAELAHATGFGEGIDFVLKRMGYDNAR